MTDTLGLGPFLDQLEGRLEELPPDALRAVVLRWASQVPPGDRRALLARFAPAAVEEAVAAAGAEATSAPAGPADVEGLVEEASDFAAAVASGDYADGVDFDPETRDWRTFGDESWSLVMDDLLQAAGAAFVAGHLAAARDTYRVLLGVLATDGGGGNDHGGLPAPGLDPIALLDADVHEAKSRYLRAIYDTADPAERPALLLAAARELTYVGDPMRLAEVEATRRVPLADLEVFLPAWIAALEEADTEPYGFGPQRRALVAEAAEAARRQRRAGRAGPQAGQRPGRALPGPGRCTGARRGHREGRGCCPRGAGHAVGVRQRPGEDRRAVGTAGCTAR